MALLSSGPFIGKYRRHHPLPSVRFGTGAVTGTARRLAARDGPGLPRHWYPASVGDLRAARRCPGGYVLSRVGVAIWEARFLFPCRPFDRRLGIRIGLGDAAIRGPGGDDGQWISGGGGNRAAWQHPPGAGLKRGPDDRHLTGDRPTGVVPAQFRRHGGGCVDSAVHTQMVARINRAKPILMGPFGVADGPRALDDAHNLMVGHAGNLAVACIQLPRGGPARHHRHGVGAPGHAVHHGRHSGRGGGGSRQHDTRAIHRLDGLGTHQLSDRAGENSPEMDSPDRLGRQLAGGRLVPGLGRIAVAAQARPIGVAMV